MYPLLISASQLQQLLTDAAQRTVVMDCSFDLARPEAADALFAEVRIAGALQAHLERDLSTHDAALAVNGGRHPLPRREAVAAWLGRMGVDNSTQVVVYDRNGCNYCGRLWWMLKWLGHEAVVRLTGPRVNRLSQRIARRGVIAVTLVRLLPLAPFGVINLIAGISHLRLRDYVVGTVLGLSPGILLTTLFAHHLVMAVRRPSAQTMGVLLIVILLLAGFAILIRQWHEQRAKREGI